MTTSVIIGAGIVGLHLASKLVDKKHDCYVLDMAPYLGEHTSGRNSGVIHAGIHYAAGSLKEQLCIEGNRLTYEWLKKLGVPHNRCGKWMVAEKGDHAALDIFFNRISQLPIPKPKLISRGQMAKLEPHLIADSAVLVPSTGVMDAAHYIKALSVFVENKGATVLLNCRVTAVSDGKIETTRGAIPFDLAFNCAGLFADEIAVMAGVHGYQIKPCRGDYYCLSGQPVTRPVYHLPDANKHGLGVHITPTTDGQTLLGPNAFFIEDKTDYHHRSDASDYTNAFTHYTGKPPRHLTQGTSGNRPKLFFNGTALADFNFIKKNNFIHSLGIESPGLTAAPAIAGHICKLL
ncbi:MAG: NAD(P)/FAD-dependent oxidoreductase [Deltaproteobacteria bacterium]|nr:NAD(P)/FAD-dependent oxidoreductase [Deltaproteobacteria bacterium]